MIDRKPQPGDVLVVRKGLPDEEWFLILPSTMEHWKFTLQIKGPRLKSGEFFCRGAPTLFAILGTRDFEYDDTKEVRMLGAGGNIRCKLLDREI